MKRKGKTGNEKERDEKGNEKMKRNVKVRNWKERGKEWKRNGNE